MTDTILWLIAGGLWFIGSGLYAIARAIRSMT